MTDVCDFTYRKPIISAAPDYAIGSDIQPCVDECWFYAVGQEVAGVQFSWTINVFYPATGEQASFTKEGREVSISYSSSGNEVQFTAILTVTSPCSAGEPRQFFHTKIVNCQGNNSQRQVIVQPNPSLDVISVNIVRNGQVYSVPSYGVNAQIARLGVGSATINTSLYSNGQSVNISTLPNGLYRITVVGNDLLPTSTTFVISR